jgi:hypothetical protein
MPALASTPCPDNHPGELVGVLREGSRELASLVTQCVVAGTGKRAACADAKHIQNLR